MDNKTDFIVVLPKTIITIPQDSYLVGNLTDMVVAEQNWQPIIDEVWRSRDPADYNGSSSQKSDFNRSWNHDRKYHHHSLEEIAQAVGYKTASAVAKRIEKIAGRYEDFAEAEYHEFLEKHK